MQTATDLTWFLALQNLEPSGFKEIDQYDMMLDARRGDHVVARSVTRGTANEAWHHGIFVSRNRVAHKDPSGNISIVNWKAFFEVARDLNPFIQGESIAYQTGVIEYGSADSDESREWSAMLAEALAGAANKVYFEKRFAIFCRIGKYDTSTYDDFESRVLNKVPKSDVITSHHHKSAMFCI